MLNPFEPSSSDHQDLRSRPTIDTTALNPTYPFFLFHCRVREENDIAMEGIQSDLLEIFGVVCDLQKLRGDVFTHELTTAIIRRVHYVLEKIYESTDDLLTWRPEVADILFEYRQVAIGLVDNVWRLLKIKAAGLPEAVVVELREEGTQCGNAQSACEMATQTDSAPSAGAQVQTDLVSTTGAQTQTDPVSSASAQMQPAPALSRAAQTQTELTMEAVEELMNRIHIAEGEVLVTTTTSPVEQNPPHPVIGNLFESMLRETINEMREAEGAACLTAPHSQEEMDIATERIRVELDKENVSEGALPPPRRCQTSWRHTGSDASEKSSDSEAPRPYVPRASRGAFKRTYQNVGDRASPRSASPQRPSRSPASRRSQRSTIAPSPTRSNRRQSPIRSERRQSPPWSSYPINTPRRATHRATPRSNSRNTSPRRTGPRAAQGHEGSASRNDPNGPSQQRKRPRPSEGAQPARAQRPPGRFGEYYCQLCELPQSHATHRCPRWHQGPIFERHRLIAGKVLCHNCFRTDHATEACGIDSGCRCMEQCQCGADHPHNSLLCIAPPRR